MYLHWSKTLAIGLLATFGILMTLFLALGGTEAASALKAHTTRWIILNYAGLLIWVFVWISDQARMRGKNLWVWVVPFLFAPLPTLALFLLYLQQRPK
jgi:hypothetical protein